ncbi:MAG: O-antigen ligase family protein, partial [Asticcacaulis sp.]|nr:O-antigen ligase family protein [Asticcacaulis sp.]
MAASLALAVAVPQMGRMQELFVGAWRGVWLEKNSLGANMAIGFVAAAAAALHNPTRRLFWGVVAAVMVFMVVMSTSKTALVSVVVGISGIGFIYLSRRGPILGILLTWLAITVLLALGAFVLFFPDHIFLLLGKDPTLTGRTYIWEGIAHVMEKRPLLGYGYGAVWTDESDYAPLAKITQVAGFRAYHAHSCWYESWLGLGLVGLCLWALVFCEVWIKSLFRTYRGDGGFFALPMLGIYTLSSLTESMALNWNDMRWCLFVLVMVKVSLRDDEDSDAAF